MASRTLDFIVRRRCESTGRSYESEMCVVPPWWWLDRKGSLVLDGAGREWSVGMGVDAVKVVHRLHGWASWVDLVHWVGGVGLVVLFCFARKEFRRNKEVGSLHRFLRLIFFFHTDLFVCEQEWVWATVSEVQNTFDFRRY